MKKAITEYLNEVEENISVGIVTFNFDGIIESNLLDIDKFNRSLLIDKTNSICTDGLTNIPDGLRKGIEVLKGNINNDDKLFGTIVLLSDGYNNLEVHLYDYVIDQIIKKGVVVHTIAYGQQADTKLIRLSKETGGNVYYTNVNDAYVDLVGKLSIRQPCDVTIDCYIKIMEKTITVSIIGKISYQSLAYIDEHVGENIKITLTIPMKKRYYNILLVSPNEKLINVTKTVIEENWLNFLFIINKKIEYGLYRIKIVSLSSKRYKRAPDNLNLSFTISAKPESNKRIINPTGKLSNYEIDVVSDGTVVLVTVDLTTCGILEIEDVKITLQVSGSSKKVFERLMFDDGIGIIKRTVQINSLKINWKQSVLGKDVIRPARIETVTLSIPDPSKKSLKVKFLATGNDGMVGNISLYEITIKCNESTLRERRTVNVLPREKVEIILDLINKTVSNPFEVYVQGIDNSNNIGEMSLPQIYNWNYQDIYDKFYKENSGSRSLYTSFWTIIPCLCVVL